LSDLDEPRIRCPSCGKLAPAMKYCIYCGAKLPQAAPPTVAPPTTGPSVPPPVPTVAPPPPPAIEVRDEILNLMSGITALYERKAALLDLFQSGQVSERVFLKLHSEYASKLRESLSTRISKLEGLKNKLNESNKRLSEVGKIDENEYGQRTDSLKAEERELAESVKTLNANIETLEKTLAEKKPSEIRDLETNIGSYLSVLGKLVGEGKISLETFESVSPDIDETLHFLDSLIKDRKEKERILREQLETLQTRYKLSELSIEEYERTKRELQAELDKIWA